jgi:anti-sigma factor ChrR (cupin superfamily)
MHLRGDELEAYLAGRLSPSQSSLVSSHLSACKQCASELQRLSEQGDGENARDHTPASEDQAAWIRVIGPAVKPRLEGRVLEASAGVLKLMVPEPLEAGTFLQVRVDSRFILAEVRYCLPKGDEFQIGVEAKDVFEMPPKKCPS